MTADHVSDVTAAMLNEKKFEGKRAFWDNAK